HGVQRLESKLCGADDDLDVYLPAGEHLGVDRVVFVAQGQVDVAVVHGGAERVGPAQVVGGGVAPQPDGQRLGAVDRLALRIEQASAPGQGAGSSGGAVQEQREQGGEHSASTGTPQRSTGSARL